MKTRSNSISRLLSLVLCICMVLSLVPAIPLVAEAATATKIYFKADHWKVDNARFAAYFFGNGEKWVSMTDSNGDGTYEVDVPIGYPSVIFCRMNPSAPANNWNNKWNQTGDLTVPTDGKTLYTIPEGTWDKPSGSWKNPCHSYDQNKCIFCNKTQCEIEGHKMVNNACSYCKKTTCQLDGHTFVDEVCSICQTAGRTVYFKNNGHWSDVQLYYYDSEKNDNGWPGQVMTKLGKKVNGYEYYEMTIPVDCKGFIFSGSGNPRPQTVDIDFTTCKEGNTYFAYDTPNSDNKYECGSFPICYDFAEKHVWDENRVCDWCKQSYCDVYQHEFENNTCIFCKMTYCQYNGHTYGEDNLCSVCGVRGIWIFFENNWNWDDIHLYYWYPEEGKGTVWPGIKMDYHGSKNNIEYYRLQIPADIQGITINGTKVNQETGKVEGDQTPDILSGQTYNGVEFCNGITFNMLWADNANQVVAYHINNKWTFDAGHAEKVIPGYAATCIKEGMTNGIVCEVCNKTLKEQEVIPVGDHIDNDENGRCDTCLIPMQNVFLASVTSNLKGKIGLHYSFILSDAVLADPDAYVQFKVGNEIVQIPVSQGVPVAKDGGVYNYEFAYEFSAKEMTEEVTTQVYYQGQPALDRDHPYSVKKYATNIMNSTEDEDSKNLVTAMVNYGAASQTHFGYKTNDLANSNLTQTPDYSNVTIEGFDAKAGLGTEKVKFYSASLILKSETTVRFFFTGNITATYNGKELAVKQRSGLYYVDVEGVAAKDLDEALTITINDGAETADVSFVPMAYCQGVWNDTTGAFDQDLKNLVCALYLYNQAANAYFKEN